MKRFTQAERKEFLQQFIEQCTQELMTKGVDYAGGASAPANNNFDEVGVRLKLDRYQILFVYWQKHCMALERWFRDRTVASETLSGRIADAVNYLLIFASMLAEDGLLVANTGARVDPSAPSTSSTTREPREAASDPFTFELAQPAWPAWQRKLAEAVECCDGWLNLKEARTGEERAYRSGAQRVAQKIRLILTGSHEPVIKHEKVGFTGIDLYPEDASAAGAADSKPGQSTKS